jgi:hypothetical protein
MLNTVVKVAVIRMMVLGKGRIVYTGLSLFLGVFVRCLCSFYIEDLHFLMVYFVYF